MIHVPMSYGQCIIFIEHKQKEPMRKKSPEVNFFGGDISFFLTQEC